MKPADIEPAVSRAISRTTSGTTSRTTSRTTAGGTYRNWLDPLALLTTLVILWELGSMFGWLQPVRFPAPSRLAASFRDLVTSGFPEGVTLMTHFGITIQRILGGFAGAMVLALPLGLLIGWFAALEALTSTIVAFCRSVATLSLLPLALIWFGTGEAAKIFLIGYGCFWVMLSNVIAAVKQVDPLLIRAARTMDVRGFDLFTSVVVPAALPRIFAGARIALGVGFMVIVGAEMIGTIIGLGALIMEARTFYRSDITVVGMLVLGVLGFALTTGLERLERLLMPWRAREGEAPR
jgi:ABC-type nitrate/sulfonate/bicarbonate transport system permease component